jgi:predicted glycosyltransferase
MHDVMAYASLYIGDSQTMAMEAAVLGVPAIRFNDFVGKIGVMAELEDGKLNGKRIPCYNLGIGILASEKDAVERLCNTVQEIMAIQPAKRKELWQARRQKMLAEKIDYAKFLTWFIENYPSSAEEVKTATCDFWQRFK